MYRHYADNNDKLKFTIIDFMGKFTIDMTGEFTIDTMGKFIIDIMARASPSIVTSYLFKTTTYFVWLTHSTLILSKPLWPVSKPPMQ